MAQPGRLVRPSGCWKAASRKPTNRSP